eukprot:CAMPEP_0173442758 /NCGR_PEP_ID=MMETSP1357-20121228/28094_1 /TAXON_ID=77926 /ORGANISM="Hemiselmis rufescens, Strain PCC563" /LENGTH=82 /DNA_ID=CAMNT_0014408567 /DNA_START=168 /DNA_END=413 /DNA_ORIENTATION=+
MPSGELFSATRQTIQLGRTNEHAITPSSQSTKMDWSAELVSSLSYVFQTLATMAETRSSPMRSPAQEMSCPLVLSSMQEKTV